MDTKERFTHRALANIERPRTFYEYYVTGRGDFPLDMLRYDAAWPATGDDAAKMHYREFRSARSIKMWSHHEPTIDRWASFLWTVSAEKIA